MSGSATLDYETANLAFGTANAVKKEYDELSLTKEKLVVCPIDLNKRSGLDAMFFHIFRLFDVVCVRGAKPNTPVCSRM